MKRNASLVALAVVMAVMLGMVIAPQTALAQGPSGSYASGISCVNTSESNGNLIAITFYDQLGDAITTVSGPDPFVPNQPWLLFTPDIGGLGGSFTGSGVVSSDVTTACSVNTQTTGGTTRVGTSEGVSANDTGEILYATQILNNLSGFSSYVAVQNASSSEADVVAEYFDANGASVATLPAIQIPGNASHIFYQDDGTLPPGFIGSASFTSQDDTEKLAGAIGLYNANSAQLLSVNTFPGGASRVFIPRLAKNLSGVGYTSGWACQNIGPGSANMTMTLTFLNQETNQTVTQVLTRNNVLEGQSWLGYAGDITGAIGGINRGFGSAVVESQGGLIACTVNEDVRSSPTAALIGQGSTYAGIPDGEQTNIISFPQIVALGESSFRGGFQYANTTGTPTTCTHRYSNGDVKSNVSLDGNGSNSVFAETDLNNNKTNFNGSVEVECGQPIVGIYNLSIIGPSASGDPFATNNGINK